MVPEDHSTTLCRPAVNFSDELPATLSVESGTKGYMADQRFGRTVGLDAWTHTARDARMINSIEKRYRGPLPAEKNSTRAVFLAAQTPTTCESVMNAENTRKDHQNDSKERKNNEKTPHLVLPVTHE